jgi:hypothetical protein
MFFPVGCGALAIILAALVWRFGNRQFGGFDQSVIVETAYRFYLGQIPFVDFYLTTPPLFFLGAGWAFQNFGVRWSSFVLLSCVFSVFTFAYLVILLRRLEISRSWSLLISFTIQVLGIVSVSYWWYNSVTSIIGVLFIAASLLVLKQPAKLINWGLWMGALFLMSLSKPNVAGLLILFCWAALLLNDVARWPALYAGALCLVLSVVFLRKMAVNPSDLLGSYLEIMGRGSPSITRFGQDQSRGLVWFSMFMIHCTLIPLVFHFWDQVCSRIRSRTNGSIRTWIVFIVIFYGGFLFYFSTGQSVVLILIVVLFISKFRNDLRWQQYDTFSCSKWLIIGGGVFTAFYAFYTNGEPKFTDLPILLAPVALVTLVNFDNSREVITRSIQASYVALFTLSCILIVLGIEAGASRIRVKLIGPGLFFEPPEIIQKLNTNSFFQDVYAGPRLRHVLAEIQEVMEKENRENGHAPRIFFGPRINFGYAAFDISPSKGLPVFWHPGVSYSLKKEPEIVKSFRESKFDLCIFLKDDFTYMPRAILQILSMEFEKVQGQELILLRRKEMGV